MKTEIKIVTIPSRETDRNMEKNRPSKYHPPRHQTHQGVIPTTKKEIKAVKSFKRVKKVRPRKLLSCMARDSERRRSTKSQLSISS